MFQRSVFLLLFLLTGLPCVPQQNVVIGFWNLENLYDTLDDPLKDDDEFTPSGKNRWNTEKYVTKLQHLSEAISTIGSPFDAEGPALLGVCEVENSTVLKDLIREKTLKKRGYDFVHLESEDVRGIDVALLYRSAYFKVDHFKAFQVLLPDTAHKTRPILLVSGKLRGEPLTILVNHWPSRRGGERASRPSRIAAAKVAAAICDSLMGKDPRQNLLLMGDFNDDPVNFSIREVLGATAAADSGRLHNPYVELFRKGQGTLAYNDRWNLFDQLIVSRSLLNGGSWRLAAPHIFAPDHLRSQRGRLRGYPHRTFSSGVYTGGYSDHFPSYIVLTKP